MAPSQAGDIPPGDGHRTKADAASEPQQCRLLELPAELRNKIYEYAVCQDWTQSLNCWKTTSSDGLGEPPLLFTCRQIRAEAAPLFYHSNRFGVELKDGDPTLLIMWTKHTAKYEDWSSDRYDFVPCETIFSGNVHWPNLMKLCRAVHDDRIDWWWTLETTSGHAFASVVGAAMAITIACKKLRWFRCKVALEGLRGPASRWDRDWLDEDEDDFEAQELARFEVYEDCEIHPNWTDA